MSVLYEVNSVFNPYEHREPKNRKVIFQSE